MASRSGHAGDVEGEHAGRGEIGIPERPAAGAVELWWSSPSTPEEIIDPLSAGSISGNTYPPRIWAGIRRLNWHVGDDQFDSNGWPKCDVKGCPGRRLLAPNGRYRVAFNGKADVAVKEPEPGSSSRARSASKLPAGVGYDAPKNRTSAEFICRTKDETERLFMGFLKTQRDAAAPPGSGFTESRGDEAALLRRRTDSHEPGEVSIRGARAAFAPYSSFRWQGLWNGGTWQRAAAGRGRRARRSGSSVTRRVSRTSLLCQRDRTRPLDGLRRQHGL